MVENIHITSSCIIYKQIVYKDGIPVFEKENLSITDFLLAIYKHYEVKYPKFYKMDNLAKLGWLAAELLLKDHLSTGKYEPDAMGIVLANANSSLDADIKYYESVKTIASPSLFVYTLPNIVIGEICIRHNIKGENAFFIFDAFDAGFMEEYVANLFNNNILQCCICGWVELLGEQYKTVLFLIERDNTGRGHLLTKDNLNKIYQIENGYTT